MILRPRMEPGARTPREHRRTRAAGQPADQREAEDQKQQGGGVEGHLSLIHSLPSLRSCFDRLSTNGGRESLGFLFQHRSIERSQDRKSVVEGQSVSVRVDLGGRRSIKKKTNYNMRCATEDQQSTVEVSIT